MAEYRLNNVTKVVPDGTSPSKLSRLKALGYVEVKAPAKEAKKAEVKAHAKEAK
jgi:hypothetical protein